MSFAAKCEMNQKMRRMLTNLRMLKVHLRPPSWEVSHV